MSSQIDRLDDATSVKFWGPVPAKVKGWFSYMSENFGQTNVLP